MGAVHLDPVEPRLFGAHRSCREVLDGLLHLVGREGPRPGLGIVPWGDGRPSGDLGDRTHAAVIQLHRGADVHARDLGGQAGDTRESC